MATGDLIKLGTFYKAGVKQAIPTSPWRSGTTPGGGNIPVFVAGQVLEIKNTDAADAYKINWREVNVGSKKLLVADRNLLEQVSWDDLNAQGLIAGKEITIDGQQFKLRVLTGGSNYRNTTDAYAGGTPLNNEWDQIIANEGNYAGLPKPVASDLDSSLNTTDLNSAHNKFWNWYYMYSWAQETYTGDGAYRAFRGSDSARIWAYNTSSGRYTYYGWRPVLEVLNSAPLISGNDENLGNKSAPFSVIYQVSDPESDAVNVVEKLNGVAIKTSTSVVQGVDREIALTIDQWASCPLNATSTITIEATDAKGAKSIRTYTFTKNNSAPTVTVVEPKGDLANIAISDKLTPIFVWQFKDIDPGDSQSAYQVVVENTAGATVHDSGKKASTQSFYQLPAAIANWGDRLKWKVRVWDKYDVASEYSPHEFFMPNRPPNVTNLQPGSLDPLTPAPAGDAPIFTWEFEDLDLEAQASYQLQVFNKTDNMLVFDSGRVFKNVQKQEIAKGTLINGATYYATLQAWDPNELTAKTEKVYFRTNAAPSTPLMSNPADNYRTPLRPTLSGIVGTDPENDGMHFAIEIARDAAFTLNPVVLRSDEVRTGWLVNGLEIPVAGVKNDQEGRNVDYTLQFDLDRNRTYYWRIASVDASTKALSPWSKVRKIRAGNILSLETKTVIKTGSTAARRMLFAADYFIDTDGTKKAELKVEYTNNALDIKPTWEDATLAFVNMDYHTFVNATKTGTEFAVGVRVTIKANDCLGDIHLDAIGLTFD